MLELNDLMRATAELVRALTKLVNIVIAEYDEDET